MSINDINFGFTPADGDVIKSQTEFARYYEGHGWDGSLKTLKTASAYMYYSYDSNDKIMTFQRINKR